MPPPPAPGQPRVVVSPLPLLVLIFLFFYVFGARDESSSVPGSIGTGSSRLERQKHSLSVLADSEYSDFAPLTDPKAKAKFLNITGFRKSDGYAWGLLDESKRLARLETDRVGHFLDHSGTTGLYHNITGITKGAWVRQMLPGNVENRYRHLNLSKISPHVVWSRSGWDKNITGAEGRMMLRIDADTTRQHDDVDVRINESNNIRSVAATMTLQDENSGGDGWEVRLYGVHWPATGEIMMTTTSHKFAGLYGLPHLATTEMRFNESKEYMNKTLWQEIQRLEDSWQMLASPWAADEKISTPHCEFITYGQAHLIRRSSFPGGAVGETANISTLVHDIESELRFPSGAPLVDAPPLEFSTVIYSPDCGFILKSKGPPDYSHQEANNLVGLKREVWMKRIKHWLLVWATVIGAQLLLLRAQMKDASTPSTLSRVSLYSIGMMIVFDMIVFITCMYSGMILLDVYPAPTIVGIIDLLSVGIGVRFIAEIFNVQEPERREQERARAAQAGPVQTLPAPVSVADGLPRPVTDPRPTASNIPIIIPSDQDIGAEIAEVAAAAQPANTTGRESTDRTPFSPRTALLLATILLLSVSSIGWSPTYRTIYVNGMSLISLSFWVPQIARNVRRNCRKALLWKFVVGESALRILPYAYFYLYADNVLFADTDWRWMLVLAGWLWLQIWALAAQEILGPRFCLPAAWYAHAWEYHPVLRDDDLEGAGLPIGLVQAAAAGADKKSDPAGAAGAALPTTTALHARCVDCAICMQTLEVPVVPAGQRAAETTGSVSRMLARRAYMVTPCRHIFHTKCLEGWMRFRLACPICREDLPPL